MLKRGGNEKKKILLVVLMVALMSVGKITAYAQDVAHSTNVEADVFAKYSREMVDDNTYRIEISKKTINQKLPNGMTVQIKNKSLVDIGITVAIRVVNKNEPLDWVTSQMKNYGDVVQPLYVSFYRNGMKVQPEGNIFINLKFPKEYSVNAAYYLSSVGEVEKIQGNYKKGSVELDAKEGFVVLMKEKTSGVIRDFIEKNRVGLMMNIIQIYNFY